MEPGLDPDLSVCWSMGNILLEKYHVQSGIVPEVGKDYGTRRKTTYICPLLWSLGGEARKTKSQALIPTANLTLKMFLTVTTPRAWKNWYWFEWHLRISNLFVLTLIKSMLNIAFYLTLKVQKRQFFLFFKSFMYGFLTFFKFSHRFQLTHF